MKLKIFLLCLLAGLGFSQYYSHINRVFLTMTSPESGYTIIARSDTTQGSFVDYKSMPKDIDFSRAEMQFWVYAGFKDFVKGSFIGLEIEHKNGKKVFPVQKLEQGTVIFHFHHDSLPDMQSAIVTLFAEDEERTVLDTKVFDEVFDFSFSANPTPVKRGSTKQIFAYENPVELGTVNLADGLQPILFTLSNNSSKTRQILSLRSTCGCTKIITRPTEIAMYSTSSVAVLFDPKKYGGKEITKKVVVNLDKSQILPLRYSVKIEE